MSIDIICHVNKIYKHIQKSEILPLFITMRTFLEKLDITELACMILSVCTWIGLSFLTPFHLHLPSENAEYRYPYKSKEIIPILVLILITFPCIWIFFVVLHFIHTRFPKFFKHFNIFPCLWTHVTTVAVTNSVVLFIQNFVGRAGPDFYDRCGSTATPDTCSFLDKNDLNDLLRSFPSTHSASAISSFLFLSLFLQKLIKAKSTPLIILQSFPIIVGFWIGATRIRDYKSHPSDVIGGFIVGITICLVFWKTTKKVIFKKFADEEKPESAESLIS